MLGTGRYLVTDCEGRGVVSRAYRSVVQVLRFVTGDGTQRKGGCQQLWLMRWGSTGEKKSQDMREEEG